jgi:hypothetical protein
MSHKPDITINGNDLTFLDAKIIGLYAASVPAPLMLEILCIAQGTLHNHTSDLYTFLRIPHCTHAIGIWGVLNGYDLRCYLNGADVLNANERERLYQHMPHLKHDKRQIKVIIITLK